MTLTPEQKELQTRRLFLEEQLFTTQKYIWDMKEQCKEHVVSHQRIVFSPGQGKVITTNCLDSVSCAVCDKYLGWFCPVNPKGYCEYSSEDTCNDDCIHCHQPEERK